MKLYFKKYRMAFLIVLMLLGLQSILQAQSWPFRYEQWENRMVRFLSLSSKKTNLRLTEMPFTDLDVKSIFEKVKKSDKSDIGMRFYNRLAQEVLNRYEVDGKKQWFCLQWRNQLGYADPPLNQENLRLESDIMGLARIMEHLSLFFDFQADTDGLQDWDYHGYYEWKGEMVGDMRAARVQYQEKNWALLIGREFVHWGPGITGSLLTSGLAPALDMIHFRIDLGPFRFQAFNSLLGRSNNEEEYQKINRYFSGHRLCFRSGSWELGVHETVMYGGPKEIVSAAYLNPLIPYYLTDVMQIQEREDNISLSLDASRYFTGGRVYVQYAVDEYYYEGENYPKRTALLVGGEWIKPLGWDKLWLAGEYVKVDRWIYNYEADYPWNRLTYYNSNLGHPIGPDADLVYFEAQLFIPPCLLGQIELNYVRQGETKITTPLYVQQQLGNHNPPFPFGTVEYTFAPSVAFIFIPNAQLRIGAKCATISIENKDHVKGKNTSDIHFTINIDYAFSLALK